MVRRDNRGSISWIFCSSRFLFLNCVVAASFPLYLAKETLKHYDNKKIAQLGIMDINNSVDLNAAILELKNREVREKQQLVANFHVFTESLKPINLIKSTFNKVKETPGITGKVLKATVGIGVGLLSKKLLIGRTPGIFKRLIGSMVEMGVAGLVAKNSDTIKTTGSRLIKNLFGSRNKIKIL